MRFASSKSSKAEQRLHRAVAIVSALAAFALLGAAGAEVPPTHSRRPAVAPAESDTGFVADVTGEEIRRLIARLDTARFASRKQAMRQLIALGRSAVPYLVEALGHESSEVRLRARSLLCDHNSFEDVAPFLVDAAEAPYGFRARTILRERALRQIDAACQTQHAAELFKFWGTDIQSYRRQACDRLAEATTRVESTRAVEPLLGLCHKTFQFEDAISRLNSISLSCTHQQSPGFVIAQTLARGLEKNHSPWVVFAQQHLAAFETLVAGLRLRTNSPYTIRKEVSDRATMSTSAVEYLVQILDESSPQRAVLSQRIGIQPDWLRQEFCRGLAATDSLMCHRRVGKVHIVDMLARVLSEWPAAPTDGVVGALVADTKQTVIVGDKPKALALLDALKACRELSGHGLEIQSGLGQRLAQRISAAAAAASGIRAYHPSRSVHDKFVTLIEMGVSPDHALFPATLMDRFLQGDPRAISDEQRLAFERYLRILVRLREAGLRVEQPGVERFVHAMRDCLTTRHDLIAEGVLQLEGQLRARQAEVGKSDTQAIDRALAQWTEKAVSEPQQDQPG